MRLCKYGRNEITGRCNKPCFKNRTKIARGTNGYCAPRRKNAHSKRQKRALRTKRQPQPDARCAPGKERVQFLTHSECLPECEYRNRITKRCDTRPTMDDERTTLDFIDDHGSLRETQTGQKLK